MDLPEIPRYKPYLVEVEKDKNYFWCSCGRSNSQPFCDGSHKGTEFLPLKYRAAQTEELLFCGCKHSAAKPFCDGTHNNLLDDYPSDDPNSAENLAVPTLTRCDGVRAELDGGCFVVDPASLDCSTEGTLSFVEFVSRDFGAKYQSQFFITVAGGPSPIVNFGTSHVVGFVLSGKAEATIGGRVFEVDKHCGVVVHPSEAIQWVPHGDETLTMVLNVCPISAGPDFSQPMKNNFDDTYPERVARVDAASRESMADRFFQILIDKRQGCTTATQFIGDVPLSKAAPHRHLYEESIVVLSGAGTMWTENKKTPVTAGDVIFLPQKQEHSLECTDPNGMLLLGVIYPGDNPSINY